SSCRLGVVGLGKIGGSLARRAAALGLAVSYTARSAKSELNYSFHASIAELAAAVDVLVLCCPGGAATKGLVNRKVLDALGPEGYLINISRGSVVDEPELLEALAERRIAGAGLDVFASEPKIDD